MTAEDPWGGPVSPGRVAPPKRGRVLLIGMVVAIAIAARLGLAWGFHGNFDQTSYEIVQGIWRAGGNVYAETSRYNYSPVWFHVLGALAWVQDTTGLAAHGVIRTFLTIVDVATAGVVYRIARRFGVPPLRSALLFIANPVSILVTGYHGSFDNLALLLVLAALLPISNRWAIVLSAAGAVVKHSVALGPLYHLAHRFPSYVQRLAIMAALGIAFGLTFVPYVADGWEGIVRNVLRYSTGVGTISAGPSIYTFQLAMLVVLGAIAQRLHPIRAALLWPLFIVASWPLVGEQFYILPLAAGALLPTVGYALYTVVAAAVLLGSPENLHLSGFARLPEILVWAVAAGWFLEFAWQSRRAGEPHSYPM